MHRCNVCNLILHLKNCYISIKAILGAVEIESFAEITGNELPVYYFKISKA